MLTPNLPSRASLFRTQLKLWLGERFYPLFDARNKIRYIEFALAHGFLVMLKLDSERRGVVLEASAYFGAKEAGHHILFVVPSKVYPVLKEPKLFADLGASSGRLFNITDYRITIYWPEKESE